MSTQIVPVPKIDVSVREATLDDVAFIDSLQREHDRQVGFLALSWIEDKIRAGQVLVAEGVASCELLVASEDGNASAPLPATSNQQLATPSSPLGYIISQDKYLHREELGLIVQLCVAKGAQRNLIGATLVKAAFERAAYGCRLFCLWCAQDLDANRFWEAMGFVPLAYRAGSEKKRVRGASRRGRVHIFWQKRIRAGDNETPWWFPSKTGNGAMREDRLVLPIPPGKHWADEMPRIEPVVPVASQAALPALSGVEGSDQAGAAKVRRAKHMQPPPASGPAKHGPRQFGAPPAKLTVPVAQTVTEKPEQGGPQKKPKATRPERSRRKIDPKLLAAVRELRDRALEHFNAGEMMLEGAGKYDVSRALPEMPAKSMPLLPAA